MYSNKNTFFHCYIEYWGPVMSSSHPNRHNMAHEILSDMYECTSKLV